jgi:tetratricopeptide (TPR) repeat protein
MGARLFEEHQRQGNLEAIEAMRRPDRIGEVYDWHEAQEETSSGLDLIRAVQERIEFECDRAKRRVLKRLLARDYVHNENFAEAKAIYLELFVGKPDNPGPLIDVAEVQLYYEEQFASAMTTIDRAVEAAYRSGYARRKTLGVKAKIAVVMKDYQVAEEALREIIRLGYERGYGDTGIPTDAFDKLPPGSIDPEVARQYEELCENDPDEL